MATPYDWYNSWQLDQTPTTATGNVDQSDYGYLWSSGGDDGYLNLGGMTPQSYIDDINAKSKAAYDYVSPYLYSDGGDSGYLDIFGAANATSELLKSRTNPNINRPAADLFSLGKGGGPMTRTVEGEGIFTDLNANQVWGQGENYDPASSVWNGWMSAQDTMQAPTTPTAAGIGRVPTDQGDQDFQNALTMADYTGTPLSADEESAYFQNAKYGS